MENEIGMSHVLEEEKKTEKKVGTSIVRFSPETEKFGGTQKFVLAKSEKGLHFASLPMGEFNNHTQILSALEKEVGSTLESMGGGFLSLYENEIKLDRSSYSTKIGPLKLKWSELAEIVQKIVGDKYTVTLSE